MTKKRLFRDVSEPHPAIPLLEHLMMKGKFSRYLHEVWRTWRVLKQVAEDPARDGMILNLEYNQMRNRLVMGTGTWVWVPVFIAIFLLYS